MRTRHNHRSPPPEPEEFKILRKMPYNSHEIGKANNGDFIVFFNDNTQIAVADLTEAKNTIDAVNSPKINPRRRIRNHISETTLPKIEEFPRGGFTKNPPEECQCKVKFEPRGAWWVENVICAFVCKDPECSTLESIMAGSKDRIARLNYKTPPRVCPHCQSEVTDRGDDKWTYGCGTICDKKSELFINSCKTKKLTKRTRR